MVESIFDTYWHQVKEELGKKPKERSLAIRLSGQPMDGFNGNKVVKRLHAALSCDGWREQVGTNWNWDTSSNYTTDSPEVKLEREIVRAGHELWARQMATSSGIQGPRLNKRRAIDLVRAHGQDHYSFIELKIEGDNPLYALFELLGYGLAYLHARANKWKGAGAHDVMTAKVIDLTVLAPRAWFNYKESRSSKEQRFDLDWLVMELNKGLASITKGKPVMRICFKEFAFTRKSIAKATKEILCIATTGDCGSRKVVVDVEASGIDPAEGHRVIELAAVELIDGRFTGRSIHAYLNPKRSIDPGAQAVHGLTEEFLEDAPEFGEIAEIFVKFVRGAELIVHNANFHLGFLNAELGLVGVDPLEKLCADVVDTLQLARTLRPGKKNSLDVLCKDLKIKKPRGRLIGAELDANLIASVYLSLNCAPTI